MSSAVNPFSTGRWGLDAGTAARSSVADIASILPHPEHGGTVTARHPASPKQRTRIWELHHSLHCSIVGTCLTAAELRQLLQRLDAQSAGAADEHSVHQLGVILAGRPMAGAKHLQKALDRKHKPAINQVRQGEGYNRAARAVG
jgi:predicted metal-dependent phosphoesterase TrpH